MVEQWRLESKPAVRARPLGVLAEGATELELRQMEVDHYAQVRASLPQVTRCHLELAPDALRAVLALGTFFPFVIVAKTRSEAADAPATEELVGYAELHRLPHIGRGMDGRLEKVLVMENWRGKGIAQKACSALLDIARKELGCGRVDLTVEKPDAMTVYKKLGFEPVDTNVWRLYF